MQGKDRVLDDIARIAGGAAGVMGGLSQSIKSDIKSRTDEIANRLDLVPREDFERLEAMVEAARLEQDALKKRIDALEKTTKVKSAKTKAKRK